MANAKLRVRLPEAIRRRMLEHAAAAPGEEVCGLIGGAHGRLLDYHPVTNAAADRTRAYLVAPHEQVAVLRRMHERGRELCGIFHSHPASAAEPSASDRDQAAWPGVYYFIASMRTTPPALNAFLFDGDSFLTVSLADE